MVGVLIGILAVSRLRTLLVSAGSRICFPAAAQAWQICHGVLLEVDQGLRDLGRASVRQLFMLCSTEDISVFLRGL